ncbi:hypothetical protein FMJ20_20835 [Klebsiella grimontii]|uniref:hypothetical protein n=1 Tax=Klebsiella grimontii TaxID=2058152 RepID=UPI001CCD6369|nr:hypothetical protein [Klebsiella grimontii]MBZ7399222.1 hypothetical protein [Klebsiella grimontii]
MAIHPILTSPAQANNISGKTYFDNGYIRKEYEITVFNNNTTEHFHGTKITGCGRSKRRGIVPPENGAKLAAFVDLVLPAVRATRQECACNSAIPLLQGGAKHVIAHTFMANIG